MILELHGARFNSVGIESRCRILRVSLNLFGSDNQYFVEFWAGRLHLTVYRRACTTLAITMARKGCVAAGNKIEWAQWALYQDHPQKLFTWWHIDHEYKGNDSCREDD